MVYYCFFRAYYVISSRVFKTSYFSLLVIERRSIKVNPCVGMWEPLALSRQPSFRKKGVPLPDLRRTCFNVLDSPLYLQLFSVLKKKVRKNFKQ